MDDNRWLAAHEDTAWRSLQEMHRRLDGELARRLSAESGLSYPDYVVLVALTASEGDELRLFELGERLGWEKSRLSHHITRMVKRDLVVKQRCPEDQRGWSVVVTRHGRNEIEAAAPSHVEAVRELFVNLLTRDQLAVVAEVSNSVLARLADIRPED
jgi:DNA-binding MarR family transcriptional regulator